MVNKINKKLMNTCEWVFSDRTKPIELFSAIVAFLFSLQLIIDFDIITARTSYEYFAALSNKWVWVLVFLMANFQLYNINDSSVAGFRRRGFLSLWMSLVWILISMTFAANYPPLSTGFFTYFSLSIMCFITYNYIDNHVSLQAADRRDKIQKELDILNKIIIVDNKTGQEKETNRND